MILWSTVKLHNIINLTELNFKQQFRPHNCCHPSFSFFPCFLLRNIIQLLLILELSLSRLRIEKISILRGALDVYADFKIFWHKYKNKWESRSAVPQLIIKKITSHFPRLGTVRFHSWVTLQPKLSALRIVGQRRRTKRETLQLLDGSTGFIVLSVRHLNIQK